MGKAIENNVVDFVFNIISHKKEITFLELTSQFEPEFKKQGISELFLKSILNKLLEDKYVDLENDTYFVTSQGVGFYGYVHADIMNEKTKRKSNRIETSIKIVGLAGSLFFGGVSYYYNHENKKNELIIKEQTNGNTST